MNGHQVLLGIAILCELGATGIRLFTPDADRLNLMALGLLFFFISLLVPGN